MEDSEQISAFPQSGSSMASPHSASERLSALTELLANLDEAPHATVPRKKSELAHQNKLVQARLGIASSLFMGLRAKHPPTAAHSLRVALACSSWALSTDVADDLRDEIEVAALLHDIGKLGVPDKVLQKPSQLTLDEAAIIERQRQNGVEILSACNASPGILDAVKYANAWYDGSLENYDRQGDGLPAGARMLAIVDAFDSMTTDHVYRKAMSRERAMAELFECAGGQFDPQLVKEFCALLSGDQVKFNDAVARRWLKDLRPHVSGSIWGLGRIPDTTTTENLIGGLFQQKLVDSMHDGVIFVDACLKIQLWNRASERLTGLPAASVFQKQWLPSLVKLRDENDKLIADSDCPVQYAIESGVQNLMRLTIASRGGGRISVDAHFVPIVGDDGVSYGAAVLLHDASSEITLAQRLERLHVKATQDPLTQVANRAEFDRVHEHFVVTHLQQGKPCSLIICDLDRFKKINDTYGHQAGDEALVSFAALLRRFHRAGDLVARYGGEEFVMLCADCDNATATARAENIRRELERVPQSTLNGRCITASFGVTEVQDGDTPETMLRRADRALLQAKDSGRNTVVQLGAGISGTATAEKKRGILSWFQSATPEQLLQRCLITPVPIKMAVEKLRGFVADHYAEILSIEEDHVKLKIDGHPSGLQRRGYDRPVPFVIELAFREARLQAEGRAGEALRTLIEVVIRPIKNRDRRRRDAMERARQLLVSLKSYLMAHDHSDQPSGELVNDGGAATEEKNLFGPLLDPE